MVTRLGRSKTGTYPSGSMESGQTQVEGGRSGKGTGGGRKSTGSTYEMGTQEPRLSR